jgi:hypothetical protein
MHIVGHAFKVLQGEFTEGDTVHVDAEGDHLAFRAVEPAAAVAAT